MFVNCRETELIPYLPYLLQDVWALGTPENEIVKLIRKHIPDPDKLRVLDLARGKGAVSIPMAKELGLTVKGYDVMPNFIEFAKNKADELEVEELCSYDTEDVIKTVDREKDWDMVMFLAAGDVLGNPEQTIAKLKQTIRPNGYIIIDECYLDGGKAADSRYVFEYPTLKDWQQAIENNGMYVVEKVEEEEDNLTEENEFSHRVIVRRAKELSEKYPRLSALFEEYVQSQLNECYDLENAVTATIMLLQRRE